MGQIWSMDLSLPTPTLEQLFIIIHSYLFSLSSPSYISPCLPLLQMLSPKNSHIFTSPPPNPSIGKPFFKTTTLNPSALGHCCQVQTALRACHCHHGLGTLTGSINDKRENMSSGNFIFSSTPGESITMYFES